MTNYASAAVPGWAAQAWVIWPVFAVLVAVSIGLLLWGRHSNGPRIVPRPVGSSKSSRSANLEA
ncbi:MULTISPECIES: hypothetical protein [unclassified Streptomyces]|uniref:hypothetical protein n=1 Tax=unclassified Streptomyces TaxID=2593676 RepID=UPI00116006C7|nr:MULTISPECIES: hypothetical protein [unclassified Streptomyces]